MMQTTLFWLSILLIIEPILALSWPRIKVGFLISNSRALDLTDRIKSYYDRCRERPFGTYGSFRHNARTYMWCIGFTIMAILAANSIFDLNLLK